MVLQSIFSKALTLLPASVVCDNIFKQFGPRGSGSGGHESCLLSQIKNFAKFML